jgi:two-component system, LuxR family, sensor kinase FixL
MGKVGTPHNAMSLKGLCIVSGVGAKGSMEMRLISPNTKTLPGRRLRPLPSQDRWLWDVFNSAVDAIVMIDEHGRITAFNRAAGKMFGYEHDEILHRMVNLLMPAAEQLRHGIYLARYRRTGKAKIIGIGREVMGRKKDGTLFPIELAVSEIRNDAGRHFVGVMRDLSERKRLEQQILQVSERERRQFARDLHDGLCQELAGIVFLSGTLQRKLQANGKVSPEEAGELTRMLQESVRHARGLARALQPVDHDPHGLAAALRQLADDTAEAYRVSCRFYLPRPLEMPDTETAAHLYRIAQECVRDVAARALAKRIVIRLVRRAGGIELSVEDDGRRSASDRPFAGELVSEMIHHRARMINGQIRLHTRPKGGLRVICTIPDRKVA